MPLKMDHQRNAIETAWLGFLNIEILCLGQMRTQNPNLLCASAFVRQSQTHFAYFLLHAHFFKLTKPLFYPKYHSGLIWIKTVFVKRERERERERLVQAHQSKLEREERERKRDRCVCMFFLNFVSLLLFFTLGTRLRISKFCVDL